MYNEKNHRLIEVPFPNMASTTNDKKLNFDNDIW